MRTKFWGPFFLFVLLVGANSAASREQIVLRVETDGSVIWNGQHISGRELETKLHDTLTKKPPPEFHIVAASGANFKIIGQFILTMQKAGVVKIGFLTEPRNIEKK